jgi:hypothetical protein
MNYLEKRRQNQIATLKKYGLYEDFLTSKYKYLSSYLKNAYREGKIKSWKEVYGYE